MPVSDTAKRIATDTSDAYSFDAFGGREWRAAAQMLLDRGYSERETEAILRSKWTRWCRDAYEGTATGLADYIDDPRNKCTPAEVDRLVEGTF